MAQRDGEPPARARNARTPAAPGDAAGPPAQGADEPGASALPAAKRPPGRPPGRRPVAARHTIRLDEARQGALVRLAAVHGRSVHSLILEAIDDLLRKRSDLGVV